MKSAPGIIYEDNHLLAIAKPTGWLVQGDKTGDRTLSDWGRAYIKEKYAKPGDVFLHPVHRIDRPVSGMVLFARTSKALERMNKLFREDHIEKIYLAIVLGQPEWPTAQLAYWLVKNEQTNTSTAFDKEKSGAKYAELFYEHIHTDGRQSLLKVMPKTGRPHQIRVQLAKVGCPIVGDLKYGYPTPLPDKSIGLHAWKLSFVHPVLKTPLSLTCRPEAETWKPYFNIINAMA